MLRLRIHIALVLLALSVNLTAKTPDPNALVAKIGDRSYTYKRFNDGFVNYLQYHKAKNLTHEDSIRYNNQYWEEMVGMYVYDQAIKAGKIKVTATELEAEIKRNPPDGVKLIKDFQTNGKFDKAKYEKALADNPEFKKEVIDYTRDLYSYNKLIKAVKNEVQAAPDSVKAAWLKAHDIANASIIHFDYTKLSSITVSDEEALLYYNEHKDDYRRENGRSYLFARFTGAISKSDDTEAKAKMNKNQSAALFTRAKEIGLARAAEELEIPLEESGLFIASDEIIPSIGRATSLSAFAFANPPGSIPDVFYTPTGDILVLELNREVPEFYIDFEAKKAEIVITATRTKRMFLMDNYVQSFTKNQEPSSYLSTATRDSIAIIEAVDITADSQINPLNRVPALNQAILATPEGEFTPLIEKDKHWYLAQVTKRSTPDLSIWDKDKKKLISEATAKLQQDHLNKWYLEQRGKVTIEDKRHEFYDILQMIKL